MIYKDFPVNQENKKQMEESPKFVSVYSLLVKKFIDALMETKK